MEKIKFPEEYVRRGKFVLHGGQETDIFYDVNALLTNDFYVRNMIHQIPECRHYVGIATGGAILAGMVWLERHLSKFSMIKDGELKGEISSGEYLLIDDVATTESSLREAVGIIGQEPREIWVAVDRRDLENMTLEIDSIFEI